MVNMTTRHQQLKVADWVEERGDSKKRDRERVRKRRRTEERMLEIPLLQFTRHVVMVTMKKQGGGEVAEKPVPSSTRGLPLLRLQQRIGIIYRIASK